MIEHIANHLNELHRRHVHIATVAIAVALSVGLYFVLPILLLAREIAMSTPIIHRFKVANAQDYQYSNTPIQPMQPIQPTEGSGTAPAQQPASGPCPAGQYLGKTESGEPQCVYGAASGVSPSSTQSQPTQPNNPQTGVSGGQGPQMGPDGQNQQMDEEFVDPREVNNALRDANNMKSQLKGFINKLKKLPNTSDDLAKISDMQTNVDEFLKNIKNPTEDMTIRGILQDFYDNNYWDEINTIRAKVELPTNMARMNKDLVRVQKVTLNKTFAKLGFDMDALKNHLGEISAKIKDVQDLYSGGDLEGAMSSMQDLNDSGQPGEIYGVLMQVRDITQRLKMFRSKDIQSQVQDVIQPVIDSFNAGDFREANMALSQISQELMQMQSKIMRMNTIDNATSEKLQKLQQTIEDKLGNNAGSQGEAPISEPGVSGQPASNTPIQP